MTLKVVKTRSGLAGDIVESPFLESFKNQLDMALSRSSI